MLTKENRRVFPLDDGIAAGDSGGDRGHFAEKEAKGVVFSLVGERHFHNGRIFGVGTFLVLQIYCKVSSFGNKYFQTG